jgi:hypothetical protein
MSRRLCPSAVSQAAGGTPRLSPVLGAAEGFSVPAQRFEQRYGWAGENFHCRLPNYQVAWVYVQNRAISAISSSRRQDQAVAQVSQHHFERVSIADQRHRRRASAAELRTAKGACIAASQ